VAEAMSKQFAKNSRSDVAAASTTMAITRACFQAATKTFACRPRTTYSLTCNNDPLPAMTLIGFDARFQSSRSTISRWSSALMSCMAFCKYCDVIPGQATVLNAGIARIDATSIDALNFTCLPPASEILELGSRI
jgi:hypothetical protein